MESTRERVVKLCREKCPPRHCKGAGSMCVKVLLVLVNFSFLVRRIKHSLLENHVGTVPTYCAAVHQFWFVCAFRFSSYEPVREGQTDGRTNGRARPVLRLIGLPHNYSCKILLLMTDSDWCILKHTRLLCSNSK